MKNINNFINQNIVKIVLVFIVLQPILDVIAAVSLNYLNISITLSSIIRFLFLIFCIYYSIIFGNNKKVIMFIFLYSLFFLFCIIFFKGFDVVFFELRNMINTFYFPIVLISFFDIFENYEEKINTKFIVYVYLIYVLLVFIPNVANIGFSSYSESKVGSVGFFNSANAVGNILSILVPFIVLYIIKFQKNIFINSFIILSSLYVFVSMGTKVPILSLFIVVFVFVIYYFIKWFKSKQYKEIFLSIILFVIMIVSSMFIIPKTSFYKNIQIHKEYLGFNSYSEIFTDYKLVDHFIFSQRLTFLSNSSKNYLNSSFYEKIFGIGYIENYGTDQSSIKLIEIDYFEILYRHGILGFVLYFSIAFSYIFKALSKKHYALSSITFKISIFLILILAFFSGHVFTSPSVSMFAAFIIGLFLRGGIYEEINEG